LKELGGYETIAKYYPVPRLINKDSCKEENRLIFEFDESIGSNRGLLLDVFNKTDHVIVFEKIFRMYLSVFDSTLEKTITTSADVFFMDRALKLKEKYSVIYASKDQVELTFNSLNVSINLTEIIDSIELYFIKKEGSELWSVISQADPSDLNIGIKPVIFDYLGGGMVPLMAEFANIIWEQVAQSAMLAPTYNPVMYTEHDMVYKNLPNITFQNGTITFVPPPDRLIFLSEYTRQVIMPVMDRIDYSDWYYDLKNHIAMRILGVFDVNNFSSEHKSLAFAYLGLFYNTWNPRTPSELIELIKKYSNE